MHTTLPGLAATLAGVCVGFWLTIGVVEPVLDCQIARDGSNLRYATLGGDSGDEGFSAE